MNDVGIMISEIAFSNMPVIMKNAGLDFFIIDCEHGGFDYADVSRMIMTAKLCDLQVIVRLPNNARKDVIKYMDMGADGLLLPMTDCAKDIREVVKYAKYQPIGKRGVSTMRAHTLYNPPKVTDYMQIANEKTKVYAQIETMLGVNNIGEILSENGVDGVFVGPNDLSADYGCLGESCANEIILALAKIGKSAKIANKTAGIITANSKYIEKAKQSGFTYFSKGSELNAVSNYCKSIVKELK